MARGWAPLCALLALAACEPQVVQAVGAPGGAYRSGQGCSPAELQGGGLLCPSGAQLGFDRLGDDREVDVAVGNLSGKQVTCRRTFCGTGSLVMRADYTWPAGPAPASEAKLGEIRHRLPATTDLYGKTLSYALYVDGPTTPVNAYVAVRDSAGRFRMVSDLPVLAFRQWTKRGGSITADNPAPRLAGATSLLVDEIVIAVYLATEVRSGDGERWTADVYVDEIAW
jgi:hypothetical protein